MWPFRNRKRAARAPAFPEPTPPPVVGDAAYQIPTALDPGFLFRGDERTGTWVPFGVATPPDAPPEPNRKDEPMTTTDPDGVTAGPYGGDDPHEPSPTDTRPISLADSDPYAGRPAAGIEDTSARLEREARPKIERPDCPHCQGTGKVLTKNDLLRASLELLGSDPHDLDRFVVAFYRQLFTHAPYLTAIFPADLAEPQADPHGRGKGQRDKLLNALVALGTTYDPDDREAMKVLDQHLALFGRSHSSFSFPDGVRPPNLDEYRLVKVILFNLLHDVAGEAWLPEFDAVWSEAYDYAYRKMGDAAWQFLNEHGGEVHARSVRR
jgi:hemoglobin-like flavoprotein